MQAKPRRAELPEGGLEGSPDRFLHRLSDVQLPLVRSTVEFFAEFLQLLGIDVADGPELEATCSSAGR